MAWTMSVKDYEACNCAYGVPVQHEWVPHPRLLRRQCRCDERDADGVAYAHSGRNFYYAEADWSSENRMTPAPAAGKLA